MTLVSTSAGSAAEQVAEQVADTAPGEWTLPGHATVTRLDNGLTVCLLSNRSAPVVTTALWYRVGTRDETPAEAGAAHFLEHMMFKGSERYGPGEVDRRTQALGGSNNAFTSHDATVYHFNFAPLHWREALAIEADRMRGLTLDPDEVGSERRVILEEIAMYEAEPWDALDQKVSAAHYPGHAYGLPVLGTAASLAEIGRDELAAFHRRFYRPGNAVLVVAGDVGAEDLVVVEEHFAAIPARDGSGDGNVNLSGGDPPGAVSTSATSAAGPRHVEQRKGEVARLLASFPAPEAGHPDHAALQVASTVLGSGRSSRLYRRLVDEEQLCVWVATDLSESVEPGGLTVAAELIPGIDPARVEEVVLEEVAGLAGRPPDGGELERARRVLRADWVLGHERVYQQALAAGFGLAMLGDLHHPGRQLARSLATTAEELASAARRHLTPEGAVIGWSLPKGENGTATSDDASDEASDTASDAAEANA